MTWLFAILVLAKSGLAMSCVGDDFRSPGTMTSDSVEFSIAAAPSEDDTGDACWHAGAQDCHCSCVHVSAIAPGDVFVTAPIYLPVGFASTAVAVPFASRDDELRPPIA